MSNRKNVLDVSAGTEISQNDEVLNTSKDLDSQEFERADDLLSELVELYRQYKAIQGKAIELFGLIDSAIPDDGMGTYDELDLDGEASEAFDFAYELHKEKEQDKRFIEKLKIESYNQVIRKYKDHLAKNNMKFNKHNKPVELLSSIERTEKYGFEVILRNADGELFRGRH